MPKVKWGLNEDTEELEGQGFYDGPCPPKGMYVVKLKRWGLKTNRNGDDMFNCLVEITDSRPSKAKYNGYAFWFNRNITEAGERFVRNFIEKGLGIPWKKFLAQGVVTESSDRPTQVVSCCGIKTASEPLMTIIAKRRRQNDDPDGEWELVSDDFAPAFPGIDPASLAEEGDEYDEDEDSDEETAEEDPEDPFAEDEDEDEDEEDDSDEDDDEEPEPPTLAELRKMEIAELRELAKSAEVYARGMKKADLVSALDEFYRPADDEEEDDDEDEDEPEDEPAPPKKATRRARR